jgi:CheY-like chemotaxis protein
VAHEAPSILISDDNRGFRETLQSMFEPQGFRTLLAEDGEQALDIARRQEVHVVLLDMHMPKLTGLEVLRLVRQFKALLPCILISADLDEAIIRQAKLAQAFSVLSKPVSHRVLTRTVDRALRWTYNWPGDAWSGDVGGADDN